MFLLQRFGLEEAHRELQLQFELHVYASLRARGLLPSGPLGVRGRLVVVVPRRGQRGRGAAHGRAVEEQPG